MDFTWSEDGQALRAELRGYIAEHLPPGWKHTDRERADLDTGAVHVHHEVRKASMLRHVRLGAGGQHGPAGLVRQRRPHLLPVDDPVPTRLPIPLLSDRAARDTGDIGTIGGFGEQLAPDVLAGEDRPEVPLHHLLGAVLQDRRRGHADADEVDEQVVVRATACTEGLIDDDLAAPANAETAEAGRGMAPGQAGVELGPPEGELVHFSRVGLGQQVLGPVDELCICNRHALCPPPLRWGITRSDTDAFGLASQQRSARALDEDRFAGQPIPIDVPDRGPDGQALGTSTVFARDEAPRASTLEGLAALKPTGRPDGVHTAGTSSQIADGAAALLLMTRERAQTLGLTPLASIVDSCLVGCDPVLMLEGPIPATRKLLSSSGLSVDDLEIIEINEAFASVVLAWERELKADTTRVNPNGGAIALGHPLGATGAVLIAKAAHELIRTDGEYGLVTMCCGGGLGTGTLLRRG